MLKRALNQSPLTCSYKDGIEIPVMSYEDTFENMTSEIKRLLKNICVCDHKSLYRMLEYLKAKNNLLELNAKKHGEGKQV